ncbi:hypothetical protein JG688_00015483 [Phytophthora aleatoria]|uniref:Uncharacterized protein n=1 Tax=Phytophthora aleatoria TaxID=2496075 RepID=A0A8J5M2N6_9STRA|nr:hypothetical protein JG688_00015483 [Phytophthora aleatoria]
MLPTNLCQLVFSSLDQLHEALQQKHKKQQTLYSHDAFIHIGNDVLVKVIPTAKTVPQIAKFAKRRISSRSVLTVSRKPRTYPLIT